MPATGHNKRSVARTIGTGSYRVILAIALVLCGTAAGEEAETAGAKILLLRGNRSSKLDLASRRESVDTNEFADNRLRGDNRSLDASVTLPSSANDSGSLILPQRTIQESVAQQPPDSLPPQPLPEGLVSEPLRNFWTPGRDVVRPAWQGRAIQDSNRTGSEVQTTCYVSETLPSPRSEASREQPHVASPPHDLPQAEDRIAPVSHLLLAFSLVTSIVALGLVIVSRASGLRRDATIHVELAGPPGTYLAAAPSVHAPASAPEASPARSTRVADFADSQFAAASLLGPTFTDQRQAEEQQRKSQESAILESLFEENVRLRKDLRKPKAASTAVSET